MNQEHDSSFHVDFENVFRELIFEETRPDRHSKHEQTQSST